MASYTAGIVKGIATANFQALLIEPTWEDVVDTTNLFSRPVEGAGIRVIPATPTAQEGAQGDTLWGCDFTFLTCSHIEQAALFRHIEYVLGRLRSFWIPSWRTDFRVFNDVQPASHNVLYVQPVGFEFLYEANRYGVYIQLNTGVYHIYSVVGYDPIVGKLFLNGSFDTTFQRDDVAKCSLIRRVRLDSDKIRWGYVTDTIVKVTLSVVEVKNEEVFV